MSEEGRLEELKAKMSDKQRKDMQDLISAELKRREGQRTEANAAGATSKRPKSKIPASQLSGTLKPDSLRELYKENEEKFKEMRLNALEQKLAELKRAKKVTSPAESKEKAETSFGEGIGRSFFKFSLSQQSTFLFIALIVFAAGKVVFSIKPVDAQSSNLAPEIPQSQPATIASDSSESDLLKRLDDRRRELEEREDGVVEREKEFELRSNLVKEKLEALRQANLKLKKGRKKLSAERQERLERLASVYGSMAPVEASPLISRLDNPTAIELLQRLPGKRLGQILGLMPKDRAIELTKLLSERGFSS